MKKSTSLAWPTLICRRSRFFSLILKSNFTQLSSMGLFIPCISCTLPKNHVNVRYIDIERAHASVRVPSKRHAHNNRPRLFRSLHTVSAQYTGQAPSMVKNKGVWLSAHGRLPGTLRYIHACACAYVTVYEKTRHNCCVYYYGNGRF